MTPTEVREAMLAKMQWILDVAEKDPDYFDALHANAFKTLTYGGVDLSTGEILALVDVINEREESPFAGHLGELRERWSAIRSEKLGG